MTRIFRSLALAAAGAAFAGGSMAPAGAALTNVATLGVTANVTNNCIVFTQPSSLSMSYDPVGNIGTSGTSSFTWACTHGAAAAVTPASSNVGSGSNWEAVSSGVDLLYSLYNDTACASGQLKNGTSESLGTATGTLATYNICGSPNTTGQTANLSAGTYTDTVTFTFNFGV